MFRAKTGAMAGVMSVTLERDGHDQQWGFRLQGGSDLGTPLSVQRVRRTKNFNDPHII